MTGKPHRPPALNASVSLPTLTHPSYRDFAPAVLGTIQLINRILRIARVLELDETKALGAPEDTEEQMVDALVEGH